MVLVQIVTKNSGRDETIQMQIDEMVFTAERDGFLGDLKFFCILSDWCNWPQHGLVLHVVNKYGEVGYHNTMKTRRIEVFLNDPK